MARLIEIHPDNPQARLIDQVAEALQSGQLIAYPTDSGYALGCTIGNSEGMERIRAIRDLDERHHYTLVCSSFAQLGQFVQIDNAVFRSLKAATPGPYTFILPATKLVPKRLKQAKKQTVGVRFPESLIALELSRALGEPILSSTLILPGATEAMTEAWLINDEIGHAVDVIIDAGHVDAEPTTVVSFTDGQAEVLREGAGDSSVFA